MNAVLARLVDRLRREGYVISVGPDLVLVRRGKKESTFVRSMIETTHHYGSEEQLFARTMAVVNAERSGCTTLVGVA